MKPIPILKDPFAVANCLRQHEDSMLCQDPKSCSLSFDVIGSTDAPLNLGTFKTGKITVKSGLNAVQYYEEIAKSKFMALGIIQKDYLINRATSSVPAALISRVPIAFSTEYLNIYPCLRDAKMHKQLSKDNECDAIATALKVTSDQYKILKEEINNCSVILWQQSRQVFKSIISKNNVN